MALWGGAARSGLPGRMLIVAITAFGAARFGARALTISVTAGCFGRRTAKAVFVCLIGTIAWCSLQQHVPALWALFDVSATALVVLAGILTADSVSGWRRVDQVRTINWLGTVALAAGSATAFCMPPWALAGDAWWHPWLLPSYGVGFLACLLGRTTQRIWLNTAATRPWK
jgi:hypothetical protein